MTTKKLSLYLFTISVVFATILHSLLWFSQLTYVFLLYGKYNPVPVADIAYWITSNVLTIIYNEYHVPITIETYFGEIVLIVLFGLECVLIGLLFFKTWELIKRKYCIKVSSIHKQLMMMLKSRC